jgi:hypothetical protein
VTEGRREGTAGDQLLDRLILLSVPGTGLDFDRVERSYGLAVKQTAGELQGLEDCGAIERVCDRVV